MPGLENIAVFIGLTVVVFGGAAILAGQTLAESWKPRWVLVAYVGLMALGARFLHYGMFDEDLWSLLGLIYSFTAILLIALVAYQRAMMRRMIRQYPWRYEASGPLFWREKTPMAKILHRQA